MSAATDVEGCWAGRKIGKAAVRTSAWARLAESDVGIGPLVSHISDFVGADAAAWRRAQTPQWNAARCSMRRCLTLPRSPPACASPPRRSEKGISFEFAATSEGYLMHDSPLDYVATETELIATGNVEPRPAGVEWDPVRPDQFADIPFLEALRARMTGAGS